MAEDIEGGQIRVYKHPSAYYVKFLMARQWGDPDALTHEGVNQALNDAGLPSMSVDQYTYLVSTFTPPDGFRFMGHKHAPSVAFMTAEKIPTIWQPNADMKRVLNEMISDDNRRFQQTLHILLMGEVPSNITAQKISERFHLKKSLTDAMVDYYKHYFWRPQSLTYAEWELFLWRDPARDALLAAYQCGPQQALYRAGFNPKYDPQSALRDTHRQIAFRLQWLAHKSDDPKNMAILSMLSREQRAIDDVLKSKGAGQDEQFKEVVRFHMIHKIPVSSELQKLGDKLSISGDGKKGSETKDDSNKENEDGDTDADA